MGLVVTGCRPAATNEAHEVFARPTPGLKGEWLEQGACLGIPAVFVSSCVRCSSSRVHGSRVKSVGVEAMGCPNAHVKVQGIACGGVGCGNVQAGLNSVTSAVGDVPLWHMLLNGGTLVGAGAPRGGGPIPNVVVPGVHQALAFALAGMPAPVVKGCVAQAAVGFRCWQVEPAGQTGRRSRSRRQVRKCASGMGLHLASSGVGRR